MDIHNFENNISFVHTFSSVELSLIAGEFILVYPYDTIIRNNLEKSLNLIWVLNAKIKCDTCLPRNKKRTDLLRLQEKDTIPF